MRPTPSAAIAPILTERPLRAFFLAALMLGLLVASPAHALFSGALPLNGCVSGKLSCVAKAKSCLLKCHQKALGKGLAVDPICLAKCRDKFERDHAVTDNGCFAKRESIGGCGAAVNDAGAIGARIDAHVQEIIREINPTGGVIDNDCAAKKLTCVGKYNKCILDLFRKAAKAGTAIGDVSKCTRLLDGTDKSCVGKLETKYTLPPQACLTALDQGTLRNQDDAFVDDVVDALVNGPRDVNTQRCTGDASVRCTSAPGGATGCGGPLGTCEWLDGPPQPVAGGGVAACQLNYWADAVAGTFDQSTGAITGTWVTAKRTYVGSNTVSEPCPICAGDPFANDGAMGGTCTAGARLGMPCDANGRSSFPSYGPTSLDCPPPTASLVADVRLTLSVGNAGTLVKTVMAASPTCNGAPGKQCLCGSCSLDATIACENNAQCASASAGTCTNTAGTPRQPNACIDDTNAPGDGTICAALGGGEGICADGPTDDHCATEPFRSCTADTDCPATNDRCTSTYRSCFVGYDGNVGDSLSATGTASPARNGAAATRMGMLACHPPTNSFAINTVVGYPGPLRFELDGVVENDGGPACPTRLSFLSTSKGPARDFGWTGIIHDQPEIGGTKVTVAATCTGTHPDCSCTYTGPIANPNAP
jgi:hypothetical protein